MNLIFLSIFEEFQNLFKDGFLSKINTEELADSNARDLVRSYFERNPLPEMDVDNPGMEIILNGLAIKDKEVLYMPKVFSKSVSLLINLGRVAQLDSASAF